MIQDEHVSKIKAKSKLACMINVLYEYVCLTVCAHLILCQVCTRWHSVAAS